MKEYQLIIFDWDGTLMDSIARIVSSIRALAQANELIIPNENVIKGIIGLSLEEAIVTLFPTANDATIEQLKTGYKKHYIELDPTPTPLFSNAEQLLIGLTQQDKMLAVATGKAKKGLQRVMRETNLTRYFNHVRCGCECHSKPHPQMLEQLLVECRVPPENAVMIGDSMLDMEMAKRAGIDSIGITHGVHSQEQLSMFQPKAIVGSLVELQSLLS
ncbi:HAD-IA family hydrolase [Thalassotalea sp. 1_MG-2023]|uniref:HAD family hydrolase n=1 Tax=Thalassotalea sp. 1_MG-2023 TaxID=3062680 RepID=UPI0026E4443E|nr:HAD-IA family hydrolase [Thalassotalea sp. 1_MG-2023]MDO6427787.1 HAD-IA family hydrolase [Thalassotalea sp. 1_MG-2023]